MQRTKIETEARCLTVGRGQVHDRAVGRDRDWRDLGVLKDSLSQAIWFVESNRDDEEGKGLGHADGIDWHVEKVCSQER